MKKLWSVLLLGLMASVIVMAASQACPGKHKDEHPPKDGGETHYSVDAQCNNKEEHPPEHPPKEGH